jgi:predicted RNA-binding protein YlxR (DUF448 family)
MTGAQISDTDHSVAQTGAARTCVVCRKQRTAAELLLLRRVKDTLVAGRAQSGRGAHVCVQRECLLGLSGKDLARAFHLPILTHDNARWLAQAHGLAETRALETLGLARRQGLLLVGAAGIERGRLEDDPRSVIILASDAAYRRPGTWGTRARKFLSAQALGHATGLDPVEALGVPPSRLADQAAYWLNLWYETRAEDNAPAITGRGA